jgi:glutamine---fructose-6-phosphate transaminase (isomerizing)
MCGIVGIVGSEATAKVIDGLCALEYRGYDSWGLALSVEDRVDVDKEVGSISKATGDGRLGEVPESSLVLGHTRWATHGGVTRANAHPHISFDGRVALVHNGVIENHMPLRRRLIEEGIRLASETDTEVAAHLVALELANDDEDRLAAIARALGQLRGEYAIGIVLRDEPEGFFGAKFKSPLLAAWNGKEAVLTSDPMAVGDVSDDLLYLTDGDYFHLTPNGIDVRAQDGADSLRPVERTKTRIARGQARPSKEGFAHYMLKEIHDVPEAVRAATEKSADEFRGALGDQGDHLTLVGSGSAFYVARIGQYFLNRFARLRAQALPSDEAPYWIQLDDRDAVIAISQSGETFDALEVGRRVKSRGGHLIALDNVPNSTLERISDYRLQQGCGPEICVLSTKSVINQVIILARLALRLAVDGGRLTNEQYEAHEASLRRLPETLR